MSTPEDGWIEWKGGECPVDPDTRIAVLLRYEDSPANRKKHLSRDFGMCGWRWSHNGGDGDIIAYRVVSP